MVTSDRAMSGMEWLLRMQRGFTEMDSVSAPAVDAGSNSVVTSDGPTQYYYREDATADVPPVEPRIKTMMVTELQPMKITSKIESSLSEIPWTRTVAAGSFVVGAILLIAGRRKSALAVSAAGAAVALLESPEIVREAWNAMPRAIRSGQDFLVRIEDFVEELNKQGQHLRKVITHE